MVFSSHYLAVFRTHYQDGMVKMVLKYCEFGFCVTVMLQQLYLTLI